MALVADPVLADRHDTDADQAGGQLAFERVSMRFPDGTHALEDVSFRVAAGELVSIVGPSGCGKSTLLRIASGLEQATGGSVAVDRSQIGYVFQDATLLPWRTVQGNVELLSELHGYPAAERRRLAAEAIATVGLTGFEQHHPKRLSGGMKMRASLARAMTMAPSVFLFDEPFGALDEITRERLNDELSRLFATRRFAGLFITHSIVEAAFLATRVLVMSSRPGRIVGDLAVPFDHPRPPELRYDPAFARLTGEISAALRSCHRA